MAIRAKLYQKKSHVAGEMKVVVLAARATDTASAGKTQTIVLDWPVSLIVIVIGNPPLILL